MLRLLEAYGRRGEGVVLMRLPRHADCGVTPPPAPFISLCLPDVDSALPYLHSKLLDVRLQTVISFQRGIVCGRQSWCQPATFGERGQK